MMYELFIILSFFKFLHTLGLVYIYIHIYIYIYIYINTNQFINRGYYMAARRYEISLRVLKYFFNTFVERF